MGCGIKPLVQPKCKRKKLSWLFVLFLNLMVGQLSFFVRMNINSMKIILISEILVTAIWSKLKHKSDVRYVCSNKYNDRNVTNKITNFSILLIIFNRSTGMATALTWNSWFKFFLKKTSLRLMAPFVLVRIIKYLKIL